jgi:hypothetical protein
MRRHYRPQGALSKAGISLYLFWSRLLGKRLLIFLFFLSAGIAVILEQVI